MELRERLLDKAVQEKEWQIKDDTEYYYYAGQIISFYSKLLPIGDSSRNKQSAINKFLKAETVEKFKKRLITLFTKVNYSIVLNAKVHNAILTNLMLYNPQGYTEQDKNILISGFTDRTIIYKNDEV